MSTAACAKCARRSPRRRKPARPRTFRSTTRCSPRSAAAPAASPRASTPSARRLPRPSAGASSSGTPSCIAGGASCCSQPAAIAREVAACFEQALADARSQGARLLELRAAASLARLQRDEGRAGDAAWRLRTAYAGFSQARRSRSSRRAGPARGAAMTGGAAEAATRLSPHRRAQAFHDRHAPHLRPGGDARPPAAPAPGHGHHPHRQRHRARPHRHPGGDGLPAQRALARRLAGQGADARRGEGLRADGGGRGLPRRAHHAAAQARELRRDAPRAPGARIVGPAPARRRQPLSRPTCRCSGSRAATCCGGEPVWVPYELVQRELHRCRCRPAAAASSPTPTGSPRATTRSRRSATAICEVVERDATTLWRLAARRRAPADGAIDLGHVDDPACREVLDRLRARRTSTCASGTRPATSASPAFCCLITDQRAAPFADPEYGDGLPPGARGRAAARADRGGAEPHSPASPARATTFAVDAWYEATGAGAVDALGSGLDARRRGPARPSHDVPDVRARRRSTTTSRWQLERLRAVGIEQVVVGGPDASRRFGLPVVRVVVPGLEGLHEVGRLHARARARGG